ncbi:MAG: type II toxin-antitoxin system HicA family toxin [Patescibacteria group bacterium]
MSLLPVLTAAKILRALLRGGYYVVRQVGSHAQLKHGSDPTILVTVARHSKDVTRKVLASILKQAKLTPNQFLDLLRK